MPGLLALLVLGVYLGAYAVRVRHNGSALPFVVLGTSNTAGNRGYDGQYYYRIASVPLGGRHGLDRPAYRYQRILYPLLARAVALGRTDAIADALVLVNIGAIAIGTLCLALLLRKNGLSPLIALAWAAYAGQVASFWRDLAEPMAMALVAVALLLLRADKVALGALALLAASLTKEICLLFALPAAASFLFAGKWRQCGHLLLIAVLPYALWQVLLFAVFGGAGVGGAEHPSTLPFGGLLDVHTTSARLAGLLAVAIPALLCLVFVVVLLGKAARRGLSAILEAAAAFPTLALLANLAFVIWLPERSYADLWASARNADGMVLAALAHPAFGASHWRWPVILLWSVSAPLLWLL
jgi:hypothetical protein